MQVHEVHLNNDCGGELVSSGEQRRRGYCNRSRMKGIEDGTEQMPIAFWFKSFSN